MSSENRSVPYGYCHCGCGRKTPLCTTTNSTRGTVKGEPRRFCQGHGRSKGGPDYLIHPDTDCWICQRALTSAGYGHLWRGGRLIVAHRWYYERANGPIPEGLELDHLCRNRACCNPDHLEPVTRSENIRRGAGTRLDWDKVAEIRASDEAALVLAERFGVTREAIYAVRKGKSWSKA